MAMPEPTFDEFIDRETGEILDLKAEELKTHDLPLVGRHCRAIQRRIELLDTYEKAELDRIKTLCAKKRDKLSAQLKVSLDRAEALMRTTGDVNLDYAGIGRFRFGYSRESVSDDEFQAFQFAAQKLLQQQHPSLLDLRQEIKPDKRAILAHLKEGKEVAGFSINPKHETFIFKAEK